MEPRPIGFDMANIGADATVAPAPGLAPEGGLYPSVDPGPTSVNQVNPIGFEMHDINAGSGGPNEVVTEKSPLEPAQGDTSNEDNMFFSDGIRRIDYILAYEPGAYQGEREENRVKKRKYYEEQLEKEGLELEYEPAEKSKSGKVAFVKVHVPWKVLAKGAEIMNMKMPIAPNDMGVEMTSCWDCIPTPFDLDKEVMPDDENYFTAPFNRSRLEQYLIQDKESFFSNAQRSRIVQEILSRCYYEDEDPANPSKRRFGLKKMINNGSYQAAYPLHDGKFLSEHSLLTRGKLNNRHLLYETWARPRTWYKFQPLDQIRNYFGEKVGIYFTWLGYYTMMLIPASIVGLVAFIYGCATIFDDELGKDICDINKSGNLTMCPLCDKRCPYWKLEESCYYSRATYLFDNPATVAFACFMALWASFFHEIWKRKQNEIEYDWDVADFEQEEETVRPEFEQKVQNKRENPINKKMEPYLSTWSKCVRYCTSLFVIIFFLCLVLAAVFGVIIYRIAIAVALYASGEEVIQSRASLIASATAACINLLTIVILNFIYQRIAHELTEIGKRN